MALGLLGRKLGMTQINDENGQTAVSIIEAGPCLVMQKKTVEKDGYSALKVGFGSAKASRVAKAQRACFDRLKTSPRYLVREFRVASEELAQYEVGQEIAVSSVFKTGQLVDVAAKSKGRGFTGVVKRWGMKGNSRTHGTHECFRHGGSIGTRTWPGYVHKNKKMAGQYGNERVTTQKLRIVQILEEQNCLLVSGAIPGSKQSWLEVRPTAKKNVSLV